MTDRAHQGETRSDALGLYLHIPFCTSICNYCNFNRGLFDDALKRCYVAALRSEIARAGDRSPVDSIFFGGGTPSLLEATEVASLIAACRDAFDLVADTEVTLEMNPESVSEAYVTDLLAAGITRISLGVQSFDDRELVRLGRMHDSAAAREAVAAIRRGGCRNLSLDLMLWLPAQTPADASGSIDTALALAPDHLSLYLLELYPNAPIREEMLRANWSLAPDEEAAAMYLDALERTDAAGYGQYEISNVAYPGHCARHNLKYWQDGAWLGFGCGAHSTRDGVRWRNVSATSRYVDAVERGESVVEDRRLLSRDERLGDALFTGLRLSEGIDPFVLGRHYGVDLNARFGRRLQPYVDAGWLDDSAGRWRLSRSGMLVSNEVLRAFV